MRQNKRKGNKQKVKEMESCYHEKEIRHFYREGKNVRHKSKAGIFIKH